MNEIYDGIRFHFIENDKFNTACIAIILRRELNRNDVTANALIPKILAGGCQSYKSIAQINKKLDTMLGAVFNADIVKKGNEQLIEFFCEVYDSEDYVIQALELMGEILLNPETKDGCFIKSKIQNEKQKLKDVILSRKNDKKEYAKQRLIEKMFENEPFGIYADGYIEDLDELNEENLYRHYQELLKTSPIEIIVMSKIKEKKIREKCIGLFNIQNRDVKYPKKALPKKASKEIKTIREKEEGLNQGKLLIGMTGADTNDFFPLLVGSEILGGSGNSKLFMKIREKENLCYYVNSFIYRLNGVICIQSGVSEDNFDKTAELIKAETEALKNGDFSDDDVENAKKSLIKNILSIKDYNSGLMDFYLMSVIREDNEKPEKTAKNISRINKKDILDAFKNVSVDTIYMMGAN